MNLNDQNEIISLLTFNKFGINSLFEVILIPINQNIRYHLKNLMIPLLMKRYKVWKLVHQYMSINLLVI